MRQRTYVSESRLHRLSGLSAARGPFARYGAAVLATAVGAALAGVFERQFEGGSFAPLLAAVGFSVWFGGIGPALVSTALGGIASAFLLLEPLYSIEIATTGDAVRLLTFVASGLLLAVVGEWARRERRRAEAAELASTELAAANERVHGAAVSLGAAVTRAEVVDVVATHLFDALDANSAGFYLVDEAREVLELT